MPRTLVTANPKFALSLNGSTQYCKTPAAQPASTLTNNFTASVWVNVAGLPASEGNFFCNGFDGTGQGTGYRLSINSTGLLVATYGFVVAHNSASTLSLNTWYNVVFQRTAGTAQIYVNGVASGTSFSNTPNAVAASGVQCTIIGATPQDTPGFISFFNGSVDDVRIYERVLSLAEIQNLYKQEPVDSTSLKLRWKLDEGTGTSATDSSGNGKTGTSTGAPVYVLGTVDVAGARHNAGTRTAAGARQRVKDFGTCLFFNGTSAFVSITATSQLNSAVLTYTAWVKRLSTGSGLMIKASSATNGIAWQIKSNGFMEFDKQNTTAIGTATTVVPVGIWTHVAVTYDASGNWIFYVNGVSAGTGTNLQSFGTPVSVYLGQEFPGDSWYSGLMDDVRIYNAVLTGTQITNLFYGLEPPTTSLQGWWKFNEGSGTTVNDSSGNTNTGTITAATYSTDVFIKPRTAVT